MKKIIVALILFCTVNIGYSQFFDIGLKLGYNSTLSFSSLNSDLSYNHKDIFTEFWNGFHIGAYTRLNFSKLYIQPELLYSRQKKEYTVLLGEYVGSYDNVVKINSLDIPILLGYKILDLRIFNLRAFVGPVFRFNIGSSLDYKNLSNSINADNFKEDFKDARVGLQAGLGVDLFMLSLDVRYNIMGNIYETSYQNVEKNTIPSNTFIFSLGWRLL